MTNAIMQYLTGLTYKCAICKIDSHYIAIMPYGSSYDGYTICGNCIRKYFDSILEQLIK